MLKRLLATLFVVALTIGLTACLSPNGEKATSNRPCKEVQTDLKAAKKEATKRAGTPAEKDANKKVSVLEEELKLCDDGSDPTTTTSTTTTTAPAVDDGDVTVEVDTASLKDLFEDPVAADELAFGSEAEAAMVGAPEERGEAAHSRETLKTPEQLVEWLKSNDPRAKPVLDRVTLAITAECGAADVKVHLEDGQGWLLMVVLPPSQIQGTSYFVDGQAAISEHWRTAGDRDAHWLPVCTQGPNKGKIVANGMVRADCGNGADKPKIRIIRPDTPEAPPVTCPPWIPGVNPPPGCPKEEQTEDQQQNGGRPVHGGCQQANCGDPGPTVDGNGNPIPEPNLPNPYIPPSGGGGTTTTAPAPTPGGYGGTGSGGSTPGGSTCSGTTCTTTPGGPTGPVVTVPGEGGGTGPHTTDPGGF